MNQMLKKENIFNLVVRAIQESLSESVALKASDRLVDDLGFDSLRVAALAVCLESELNYPVTLNEWIACADSPSSLTVGSLVDFITQKLLTEELLEA